MNDTRRKLNSADEGRLMLREQLWPGSADWVWTMNDKEVKGFATMSRLMPWIMNLIDDLSGESNKKGAPSKVYLELWCRDFGQGIITITDEEECAFAAGYVSVRAARSWKERILKLLELKFILAKPVGNREYGQILLLNPLAVCAYWNQAGKVPVEWWNSFFKRAQEIKAQIPPAFDYSRIPTFPPK